LIERYQNPAMLANLGEQLCVWNITTEKITMAFEANTVAL
jgi:hypothetical protein